MGVSRLLSVRTFSYHIIISSVSVCICVVMVTLRDCGE